MRQTSIHLFPARSKAFTLVELLVVIAIISLLAAILFPVFGRARENARRSSCQTAMRYIGLGVRQYAQDFDEHMPLIAVNDSPGPNQAYGWADAILPYTKSPLQFQCPSDTVFPPTTDATGPNGTLWDEAGASDYYFNARLNNIAEAKLATSPSIIMLGEGLGVAGALDPYVIPTAPATPPTTARASYDGGSTPGPLSADVAFGNTRHMFGANYTFADGHMKWLQPQQVTGGGATPVAGNFTFGVG
jgi:prepilin-type N-terminal cleavage/methylation domain-containing protein/prepilin-type processing-associated H-X9-DG protein